MLGGAGVTKFRGGGIGLARRLPCAVRVMKAKRTFSQKIWNFWKKAV